MTEKEVVATGPTQEEFEALREEMKSLQAQLAAGASRRKGGRCPWVPKGKPRCIVPLDDNGRHADGNANHYNGNSHYTKDGAFVRG